MTLINGNEWGYPSMDCPECGHTLEALSGKKPVCLNGNCDKEEVDLDEG